MGKPDMAEIMRRLDAVETKTARLEKVILQLPPWAFKTHAGDHK